MENLKSQSPNPEETILTSMKTHNYENALVLIDQVKKELHFLSPENQIRQVECLYQIKRYLEVLELTNEYMESGNMAKSLIFLRGLALYQLKQWEAASQTFASDSLWSIWLQKSKLMQQIQEGKAQTIVIGGQIQPQPLSPKIEWNQNKSKLFLTLLHSGNADNQLSVHFYSYSVEVTLGNNSGGRYERKFELYAPIVPSNCQVKPEKEKIELTMAKASEANWPQYEVPEVEIPPSIEEVDSIIKDLPEIEDIPCDIAAERFEQTQGEMMPNGLLKLVGRGSS